MGRILAIDYGRKRCGVAVTDILQISANGLPTVRACDLLQFVKEYCGRETVDKIIVGEPRDMQGNPSESMRYITPFLARLKKELPDIPVEMFDERFTSTIAHREMLAGGFSKKQRQEKGRADEMAAVLILTGYLESRF
ncbi:Holliday junction resolvase RuvX [Lepagella muris]|jgi:putative Holliday junction resolvase|uniref:Holliday junction resolvase RuvX n=1 Tax=Lepagella muris TaxID=3032870 RepID=A0AC61RE93_9BACT|nr:Holliday junction resolvase RuvX [Lepagella muris]ROT03602.1 Holliday junction resolvase RuvX [Muribaculaceae bacterium Isolate-037 (Harlan)]TGY77268.1 Holliday junction resolvase RuvX [Lepagella muris]THG49473.1 Holliday junction resolvase RuvX [Bacteroidales bacterium]TKC54782.1 Holliday junction resolvase RuvX [Bacteroidales bacterium]